MENLTFCPKCGNKTLQWDGEKKWSCVCDFVLYNNVAGAVAVLIKCGEEYLFTKRNQEPKKGKLDLAGGFVDPKESAETTCRRELEEEMNIVIEENKLQYLASLPNVYQYKNIDYNTLDLFFLYEISEKMEVQLELSEISEIQWLTKENLILENVAFDSQKSFLKNYFDLRQNL